jgi:hypothetical protein
MAKAARSQSIGYSGSNSGAIRVRAWPMRHRGICLQHFRLSAASSIGKAAINQIDKDLPPKKPGSARLPSDRVGHLSAACRIALARCWIRFRSPWPPLAPIGFRSLRRRSAVATPAIWSSGVRQKPGGAEPKQIKDLGSRHSPGTSTNEHPTHIQSSVIHTSGSPTAMNRRNGDASAAIPILRSHPLS